ncbi:MAG: MarR family winged helix-turn-helix transcriptional regulator [Ornithinibacter sp.]
MQLPPDAPLSDHLAVLSRQLSRAGARQRGELGIADYAVLSLLDRTGPRRVCDLADANGPDASTVSRRVTALADRDLLVRTADPDDARAHPVALSDRGRAVLSAERRRRADLVDEALADWPEPDRADLTRLLVRLSASLAQRATTLERTPA